jgi:hypothetical protein
MLVAVVAIMAGHISGSEAATTDTPVGMSTVALAEQAIKHDVFWASEYARDEGCIPPITCSEWADVEWEVTDAHECYMMRKRLQTYWAKNKDKPAKKLKGHEAVIIDPDTPKPVAKRVRNAVHRCRKVFDEGLGSLPLPVHGGEVHIRLKDGYKPQRCPEPMWGHGAK